MSGRGDGRRVRLTKHAEERIWGRGIQLEAVMEVLEKPDYRFFDAGEDTIVYVSKRNRLIVVVVPEGSREPKVACSYTLHRDRQPSREKAAKRQVAPLEQP